MNGKVLEETRAFVKQQFDEHLPSEYVFHNLEHTLWVVDNCVKIGKEEGLSDDEMEVVELAAFFHDIGYTQTYEEHEEKGAEIATDFLVKHDYPKEKIEQVRGCILATKMPQAPQNKLEEVLCDADLLHIGTEEFDEKGVRLRQEWKTVLSQKLSDLEWCELNLEFLKNHQFNTDYAKSVANKGKADNIIKIQKMIEKLNTEKGGDLGALEKQLSKKLKKEMKAKRPERGIETMFRTTSRNHTQLSAIADNKANIMLSINAIVISIVVSALVPRLDNNSFLIFPTVVLLTVCVASVIFATLSTIPKVTRGKFTREDIKDKTANLLFFGNFHNVDLDEYEWGMNSMMEDREFLYRSMIRDLYFLGKVLSRKYRFLRICYNVFMYGIIIAVITFVIAFMTIPEAPY